MADSQTISLESWREEATLRGGGTMLDCRMRCPLCKHVATPRQFKEAGADPERAARECIGRVTGAEGGLYRGSARDPVPQPCDWAAFGLFGTLNEGNVVLLPNGKEINVFSFADD